MAKKSMGEYAKGWKSPAERHENKRAEAAKPPPKKDQPKAKGADSGDSKGPTVNAWTKSATKQPKG